MRQRRLSIINVTVLPWHYTMNCILYFAKYACKFDANSNKLFVLLEPHNFFRFQYRLLAMTAFFEIALFLKNYVLTVLHCTFPIIRV